MSVYYGTFNILGINLLQLQSLMAISRNSILALLSLIIPVLLQLIEWKFQNESISVFEVHPITIKVAIDALILFALSFGIEFTFEEDFSHLSPIRAALLRTIMVFSGSFFVASLASILFPDEWRPLIYLIYAFLSLGNCLYMLVRKGCEWVQGMMDKLQNSFTVVRQRQVRRSQAILPLTNMDRYTLQSERMDTSRSTASTSLWPFPRN